MPGPFDPLSGFIDAPSPLLAPALLQPAAAYVPGWDGGGAPGVLPAAFTDWDRFVVMGQTLPGRAMLTGDRGQKLDVKSSPGTDGSTITNTGLDNGVVQVKLQMWTRAQVSDWSEKVKLLEPLPGRPRKNPIDVYHPSLAIAHVKSLVVKNVGFLQPVPGQPGLLEVTIRFMEFMPAAKGGTRTAKKSQSTTDGKNVKQAIPAVKPPHQTGNHP